MTEKINKIDNKLSELLNKLTEEEYLSLINNNECLKQYDNLMADYDIDNIPETIMNQLSNIIDDVIILLDSTK